MAETQEAQIKEFNMAMPNTQLEKPQTIASGAKKPQKPKKDSPALPSDSKTDKKPDRKKLVRIFKQLETERIDYEKRWKAIRDYELPFIGHFDDTADNSNPARRKDTNIAQGCAWLAAQVFAAGVMSGLTPPSRQWFKFSFSNSALNENLDVLKILDQRQEIVSAVLAKSNFYNSVHSVYLELPFGQCPLCIFKDAKLGVRFMPMTIGTYFIAVDGYGKVNTIGRRYELTISQLADNFGKNSLPQEIQRKIESGTIDLGIKKTVYWLVYPNKNSDKDKLDNLSMPYKSVYWLADSRPDDYLYVGGFEEFPAPVARYLVNGLEAYAKGPGWFAEGDSKQLQVLKKDFLTALELSIKPPMVADSETIMGGINLIPGGITPRNPGGTGKGVEPLFNVGTNLQFVSAEIQSTEDRIKKEYNSDLFLMMSNFQPNRMTASEVNARLNESLRVLGPVTERLQDEFLTPLIERVYSVLDKAGMFPPIPPETMELLGADVKIEYISPLAQAQKMSGLTNIEQAVGFVMQMAQAWPDAIKAVDPIGTVNRYMDCLGSPADMRRSVEEVKSMIDKEQEALQQQQQEQGAQAMAQAIPGITQAAKNATEAANDGNPALRQMLGMGEGV